MLISHLKDITAKIDRKYRDISTTSIDCYIHHNIMFKQKTMFYFVLKRKDSHTALHSSIFRIDLVSRLLRMGE